MSRSITYEYRRPGKPVTIYHEWLVLDRPDVKVLLLDPYEGPEVRVGDRLVLQDGAPIVWYVFPDRWYDVGRFHLGDGTPTGWYTNLARPPVLEGERWIGNDLFLDLWQSMDGAAEWLDEDELREAVRGRVIDRATEKRIKNERTMIQFQLDQGDWPPPIAKDIDLGQARSLKGTDSTD
jgi:predicted RNA-binding protein associated with RNAse of E/G family